MRETIRQMHADGSMSWLPKTLIPSDEGPWVRHNCRTKQLSGMYASHSNGRLASGSGLSHHVYRGGAAGAESMAVGWAKRANRKRSRRGSEVCHAESSGAKDRRVPAHRNPRSIPICAHPTNGQHISVGLCSGFSLGNVFAPVDRCHLATTKPAFAWPTLHVGHPQDFGPLPAMHWSSLTTFRGPPSKPVDQSWGSSIVSSWSRMSSALARS